MSTHTHTHRHGTCTCSFLHIITQEQLKTEESVSGKNSIKKMTAVKKNLINTVFSDLISDTVLYASRS